MDAAPKPAPKPKPTKAQVDAITRAAKDYRDAFQKSGELAQAYLRLPPMSPGADEKKKAAEKALGDVKLARLALFDKLGAAGL